MTHDQRRALVERLSQIGSVTDQQCRQGLEVLTEFGLMTRTLEPNGTYCYLVPQAQREELRQIREGRL